MYMCVYAFSQRFFFFFVIAPLFEELGLLPLFYS